MCPFLISHVRSALRRIGGGFGSFGMGSGDDLFLFLLQALFLGEKLFEFLLVDPVTFFFNFHGDGIFGEELGRVVVLSAWVWTLRHIIKVNMWSIGLFANIGSMCCLPYCWAHVNALFLVLKVGFVHTAEMAQVPVQFRDRFTILESSKNTVLDQSQDAAESSRRVLLATEENRFAELRECSRVLRVPLVFSIKPAES